MKNLINSIRENFDIFKNIIKLADKKVQFIFYSESKYYQKYNYILIDQLAKKYPNQIFYVSSDKEDKYNNFKVNNLYIGNGILMHLFFSSIKAKYFFLTLTDLGNHFLKKKNNIDNYVYYFHSPDSTFKSYTAGAFDNYDIILCNGPYQTNEIRFRENLKTIKKKKLIPSGYFYFDYSLQNIDLKQNNDEILVAPSWSYKHSDYIDKNFVKIIEQLLKKNYKVTFRPHPEHFKRSKKILHIINESFKKNENYKFDDHKDNIGSMQNAKCLITDESGISMEYLVLFNRPVLILSEIEKTHNKDYLEFKDFIPIEKELNKNFSQIFKYDQIENIDSLIEKSIIKFKSKNSLLKNFIKKNFYNFGKVKIEFEKILENRMFD